MSFKRDGDDAALLHNLKMRRVGELLGDNIPDDEATLLSNGRLTCLICSHRPVFDTFAVLASHRKGKKHIIELGKYLSHKRELQFRQLKDEQKKLLLSERVKVLKAKEVSLSHPKNKLSIATLPNKGPCKATQKPADLISPTAEVRHYLKGIQRKRALQKTVERCRDTYSVPADSGKEHKSGDETSRSKAPVCVVPQDSETVKRHMELKMSGWLQGPDGKWTKDPNAEFDSDEESPEV